MKTFISEFHNVYGPHGTCDCGGENAPAVISRKVMEAKDLGSNKIVIGGAGTGKQCAGASMGRG